MLMLPQPPLSSLRDASQAVVFTRAQLPADAAPAASIAAGGANTAVVTASGRLLLCGCCASGQCTTAAGTGSHALLHELTDVGPDAHWHGMARQQQRALGGGGGAADVVTAAALGRGTVYALTSRGELFAWGAGGQGELGTGGAVESVLLRSWPCLHCAYCLTCTAARCPGHNSNLLQNLDLQHH